LIDPQEINWCQTWSGNTQGGKSFTACIVYTVIICWHFQTYNTGKTSWSLTVNAL